MESTLDKLAIYKRNANSKTNSDIDNFISKKNNVKVNIKSQINQILTKIPQVEDAISKSSPEMGLDPQMEPLVTSFVSDVEDTYNELNDQILIIKEFEMKLLSFADTKQILHLTDSTIEAVSKLYDDPNKNVALKKAKEIQKKAYNAFSSHKNDVATKLSTDAYYSVIDQLPSITVMQDLTERLNGLVDRITELSEVIENAEINQLLEANEAARLKKLITVSEQHISTANTFIQNDNGTSAKKELAISDLLVDKVAKVAMEFHGTN